MITDEEMAKECKSIADGLIKYLRLCLSSDTMKKIGQTEKGNLTERGNLITFHAITNFIADIVFNLQIQSKRNSSLILGDIIVDVEEKIKVLDETRKNNHQIVKGLIDLIIKNAKEESSEQDKE